MPVVKQQDAGVLTRDAIVLDLGDLRRQANRLIDLARSEAARIQEEALGERARIVEGADAVGHQQGFARGLEEGRAAGIEKGTQEAVAKVQADLARLQSGWAAGLDAFSQTRDRFIAEGQADVIRLAAAIASKVCKRQVELAPELVADQMAEVLALVMRPTRLRVSCHPGDRELLTRAMPLLTARCQHASHVELVDDPSLQPGSCVAALAEGGGTIDASMETQLQRIVDALLPVTARRGDA